MKIHIFGPAGAGTTTLGKALATDNMPYFDVDDYRWEKTVIPFTTKLPNHVRQQNMLADIAPYKSWIIGGELINWDDFIKDVFDLVVFVYVPQDIRIDRIKKREYERYGDKIYHEPLYMEKMAKFIAWIRKYEDDTFAGSSKRKHLNWLKTIQCPILKIEGDTTTEERINAIVNLINRK
ncbi:MAG: AAA family ATPase [Bacteroidota bacterium]